MFGSPDPRSEALVHKIVECGRTLSRSDVAIFYWFDERHEMGEWQGSAWGSQFQPNYRTYEAVDPMAPRELAADGTEIAFFQKDRCRRGVVDALWLKCCEENDILDEAELLFWKDGVPLAGLALLRNRDGIPYSHEDLHWESMRSYFEFTVHSHETVKARTLDGFLRHKCQFSAREIDVVSMIAAGASNMDIAAALGVELSTIKTHVLRIFDKLGVNSRHAATSLLQKIYHS
ncbi:MAG: helix-turn-helix transcriptional regulator [Sphingobium sp.]